MTNQKVLVRMKVGVKKNPISIARIKEDFFSDIYHFNDDMNGKEYTILEDWPSASIKRLARKFRRHGLIVHSSPSLGYLIVEGRHWSDLDGIEGVVVQGIM